MTREEIIRLAEKVYGEVSWSEEAISHLETVVNLAVAAEREACAKLTDAEADWWPGNIDGLYASRNIEAAIRARGKK
jgi:hypothetical protein